MSKGPEQKLKDDAHDWLLSQQRIARLWFFKVHGSRFQRVGLPDYIICVKGLLIAPELKSQAGRASIAQRRQIALIRAAGGIAGPCRSLDVLQAAVAAVERGQLNEAQALLADKNTVKMGEQIGLNLRKSRKST